MKLIVYYKKSQKKNTIVYYKTKTSKLLISNVWVLKIGFYENKKK
jgi:hypothetical protein